MQKLFHFDTAPNVYRADACVISCYDARFENVLRKFLKRRGLGLVDHLKIAGSVKGLASPENATDRDYLLRMIRISKQLHQPPLVILVGHTDCGAYGSAGPRVIAADLVKAHAVVRRAEPDLQVECYFSDFDGMYTVGEAAAAMPASGG